MSETIMSKVVGVSYTNPDGTGRQTIIEKYVDPYSEVLLEHDIENQYSENAVAVYVFDESYNQKQIGYLSEDLASRFHDQLDNVECFVEEVTGEDKGTLGVNIRLVIYTDEEMQERAVQKQKVTPVPPSRLPLEPIGSALPKPTVKTQPPQPIRKNISPKSRTTALTLCILLGYFGGHQFYAGRKTLGIIYIFTLGLFTIGWAIDFILIILGQYKDKYGDYISNW